LQRPLAHAQLARYLVAARLAIGQAANDRLAHAKAGLRMLEVLLPNTWRTASRVGRRSPVRR
jgi:hypothetical protein